MEMTGIFDVLVIGAGPAGSAAAITAAGRGLRVALLEAGRYPRHKVCGEFVSAEANVILRHLLQADDSVLDHAPRIRFSRLHSSGREVAMALAEPAYSIPRVTLDDCLWRVAASRGIDCRIAEAKAVTRVKDTFDVTTTDRALRTRSVINASGRWSRITQNNASGDAWIGLKAHFTGETDDAVDLYFMDDGYCGVQAVAPGILNACALVKQGSAKQLTDVQQKDDSLRSRSSTWTQITETFATAPVYLGLRTPAHDGIINVGDAAGFVDPFVGDGISLALRSGILAGRTVLQCSAAQYSRLYSEAFAGVFRSSQVIRSVLAASGPLRPWLMQAIRIPSVGRRIFQSTRAARLDVLGSTLAQPGRVNY